MSGRDKSFEEQLAALADQMSPMLDGVEDVELSEELLIDYYAGVLSPEETERVGRLAALSPKASDYLAQLALDEEEAAEAVTPKVNWSWMPSFSVDWSFESIREVLFPTPQRAFALAGGAMAAILAIVIVLPPMLQGPPDFGGQTHRLSLDWSAGVGKEVVTLPGNEPVGDVDATWPLHMPLGDVESLKWFVWDALEGAATYRVELYESSGDVLFRADRLDEPYVKAKGLHRDSLVSGDEYVWLLEAFDSQGELVARGVGRFQLVE